MEPNELPGLHMAVLDDETVCDLFRDLSLECRVLEIRVKDHATALAASTRWDLEGARQALARGSVRGVQIRYALGTDVWCDTLLRTPEGIRLVRIRDTLPPGSATAAP